MIVFLGSVVFISIAGWLTSLFALGFFVGVGDDEIDRIISFWLLIIFSTTLFFSSMGFSQSWKHKQAVRFGYGKYSDKTGKFEWTNKYVGYMYFWSAVTQQDVQAYSEKLSQDASTDEVRGE